MRLFLSVLLVGLLVAGCRSDDPSDTSASPDDPSPGTLEAETLDDTLIVDGAWARTGPQGGMSAAYLRLLNTTGAADTLLRVTSPVAELVELHESYEREGGMRGMRKIPPIPVPPDTNVMLEPGGRHVMLIRLTRGLAEGDSLALTFTFARHGARTLSLPVRPLSSSPAPAE
jgi:copper(I)-binding protein